MRGISFRLDRRRSPPHTFRQTRPCIRTIVIDPSALFRAGLAYALHQTRFRVVSDYSSIDDLPESVVLNGQESMALIGVDQIPSSVLSHVSLLKAQHAALHVVMLGTRLEPEDMMAAIESGADGYLLKNEVSVEALVNSLDLVLMGETIIPQGLIQLIRSRAQLVPLLLPGSASDMSQPHVDAQSQIVALHDGEVVQLSGREETILLHLTRGASNKHIARELEVAEATVKVHVKSILRKIRAQNRTQAAMWARDRQMPTNGG